MIELIIILVIVGAALYLLQFAPLDAMIKRIIYVVAIVLVLVWLLRNLSTFGLGHL